MYNSNGETDALLVIGVVCATSILISIIIVFAYSDRGTETRPKANGMDEDGCPPRPSKRAGIRHYDPILPQGAWAQADSHSN
ncbi:hypothetical protein PM082_019867 [Marasmius tenuissimus]|nr:hypothetical protein PM082_019867 [Marasmius tenuissimus]